MKAVLLLLLWIWNVETTPQIVTLSSATCQFFNTFQPYDEEEYILQWHGEDLPGFRHCRVRFKPADEDRKICIKSQSFNIQDCSLVIYGLIRQHFIKETYSCNDTHVDFCGPADSFTALQLVIPTSNDLKNTSNSISLKITVEFHFNTFKFFKIISIALGCITLLSLLCILKKSWYRRFYQRSVMSLQSDRLRALTNPTRGSVQYSQIPTDGIEQEQTSRDRNSSVFSADLHV